MGVPDRGGSAGRGQATIGAQDSSGCRTPLTRRAGNWRSVNRSPRLRSSYPFVVVAIEKVDRKFAPLVGTEPEVVWAMVDFYRGTLLNKCLGLTDEQMALRSVEPSLLSLLGLLRHMTEVERYWFEEIILQETSSPIYGRGADADLNNLESAPFDEVVSRFLTSCARSRSIASGQSLDRLVPCDMFGKPVGIRWIAVHMVEEYARHCGHADLLREAIDGTAGL